ncbi:hypothetical protein ACFQXB_13595 [Plastorhodobacter daqingensis]|uniref:Transposase putative helix-turn-helix domain-containing protein n=1 Tax=Plastorhodobacter daqingensis TaxID=1387281 RepID=A0ABW2UKL0_9RHOB
MEIEWISRRHKLAASRYRSEPKVRSCFAESSACYHQQKRWASSWANARLPEKVNGAGLDEELNIPPPKLLGLACSELHPFARGGDHFRGEPIRVSQHQWFKL